MARRGGRAARLAARPAFPPAPDVSPALPAIKERDEDRVPGTGLENTQAPLTDLKQGPLPGGAISRGDAETADRILLIACGALARELIAIRSANRLDHLDITCLPAKLHLLPDRISTAVEHAVLQHRDAYRTICVVYADCGTGGQLAATCARLGVEMIAGPHCYAFFDGLGQHERLAENELTAFYLTDFLVRQFDAFVWTPMGLDRHPHLRDDLFGNYTHLIYQSQTDDADLLAKARDCAKRMGLEFLHRHTGYGDLETQLDRWAARKDTGALPHPS